MAKPRSINAAPKPNVSHDRTMKDTMKLKEMIEKDINGFNNAKKWYNELKLTHMQIYDMLKKISAMISKKGMTGPGRIQRRKKLCLICWIRDNWNHLQLYTKQDLRNYIADIEKIVDINSECSCEKETVRCKGTGKGKGKRIAKFNESAHQMAKIENISAQDFCNYSFDEDIKGIRDEDIFFNECDEHDSSSVSFEGVDIAYGKKINNSPINLQNQDFIKPNDFDQLYEFQNAFL